LLTQHIKANAVHLFPKVVQDHPNWHKTGIVKPAEIFDVVCVNNLHESPLFVETPYKALLTYGPPNKRKTAPASRFAGTPIEALEALLTSIGERVRVVEIPLHSTVAVTDGGVIDGSLLS
jgi:hypothetical protein